MALSGVAKGVRVPVARGNHAPVAQAGQDIQVAVCVPENEPAPAANLTPGPPDPRPPATDASDSYPHGRDIVDTLIAAGIANNRAEAIRWALTRIRERPAYEQLREHTRDIDRLKSEF